MSENPIKLPDCFACNRPINGFGTYECTCSPIPPMQRDVRDIDKLRVALSAANDEIKKLKLDVEAERRRADGFQKSAGEMHQQSHLMCKKHVNEWKEKAIKAEEILAWLSDAVCRWANLKMTTGDFMLVHQQVCPTKTCDKMSYFKDKMKELELKRGDK